MKEEKDSKRVSVNVGFIIISIVLVLILIADIIIIINNKRNDERLEQITQNIITQNKEKTESTNITDEVTEYNENSTVETNENTNESIEENVIEEAEKIEE